MDRQQAKDTIARYRFEIKQSREANRSMRLIIRDLKGRPMGKTDPIKRLNLQCAVNDRLALIRDRQRAIEETKIYL